VTVGVQSGMSSIFQLTTWSIYYWKPLWTR